MGGDANEDQGEDGREDAKGQLGDPGCLAGGSVGRRAGGGLLGLGWILVLLLLLLLLL